MSEPPRTLDHAGAFKRIDALDSLYANWDRRRAEYLAFDGAGDSDARNAAAEAMEAAEQAYEAARDTPYQLEESRP
jgi:hypothetical protein